MKIAQLIRECIDEVITETSGKEHVLTPKERNILATAFARVGLDGNGRFEKKERGLQAVTGVLQALGFNLDMVSGDIIMGDKGSRMLPFRRVNAPGQDTFTEQPMIENSRIVFTWENLARPEQPARFEILCYAS